MTLYIQLCYYVTELGEEKSVSNIKEKNLCPWEVNSKNDLIDQL
jgi:hypothetical protein